MANKNDLLFDKPTLVDGGQSQDAVVVTSPDKQHVNAPTVEDIKRIAKGEAEEAAEAASATEWEKSVKDHLYVEDGYVVADSTYGFTIIIEDTATGFGIVTDPDNDVLCFDFEYLQLGTSDISSMYIDVYEQEIGCTNVRCESITDSETDEQVVAEHLLDGKRVYKHDLTIDLGNATFFYVSIFNSSAEAITTINAVKIAVGCAGLYEAANLEIGYIEGIESAGNISIRLNASGVSGMIDDVTDDVTQC